jgi:VanZ family protein
MLYAPLFIWIGVIFLLSSGQGASTRTSIIIRPILEFLFPAATEETIQLYHGFIRKCAHFTEYAVLGVLACRAFAGFQQLRFENTLLACGRLRLAISSADEFNQSFNPERTGSPVDVLIDLSGGLFGYFIYVFDPAANTKNLEFISHPRSTQRFRSLCLYSMSYGRPF